MNWTVCCADFANALLSLRCVMPTKNRRELHRILSALTLSSLLPFAAVLGRWNLKSGAQD